MKRKLKHYLIGIALPLIVGALSGWLSKNGMQAQVLLNQPPFTPPQWAFPVVWCILYVIMGITSTGVYYSNGQRKSRALLLYVVQLVMNFCWSIAFFVFQWWLFAAVWLAGMILVIIAMNFNFYVIQEKFGWWNVPYLVWCFVALYLNIGIYYLN